MAKEAKPRGLVLTLDGAPDTPHTFPGVTGLFRPGEPVPVGEGYDISLERAKEIDADAGAPLSLVDLGPRQVKAQERKQEAEEQAAQQGEVADPGEVV